MVFQLSIMVFGVVEKFLNQSMCLYKQDMVHLMEDLLAEIIHAAGWTSNEGGGISYNIPYAKSISLSDSIYYWQYCDRLVGYYEEQGISINREPFGPLNGNTCSTIDCNYGWYY
jgi:hypothetical protein